MKMIERHLQHINATDGSLKAWLLLDEDGAREQAKAISPDDKRPLAGVPVGIKDIFDVAGMPTTAASRVLRGNLAAADAPAVARLREAGAIILGKTNTHEFAYGFVSPPTANPWDLNRIPGGSSGGSAAAVAASHCAFALGSDTGGSVRVPAALCGVSGLKPKAGSIPIDGVIPLAPSYDVVGPIARTAAELRALWDVLSDTASAQMEPPFRIGFASQEALPELDAGVAAAFEEALATLGKLGKVAPAKLPHFQDFDGPRAAAFMPEVLEVHRAAGWWPDRASDYTEEIRSYLEFTESRLTPQSFEDGRLEIDRLGSAMRSEVSKFDVVATPTCSIPAPTHEQAAYVEENSIRRPVAVVLGRLTSPVNLSGLAAVTIPCGFTSEGLPVGLQLIGEQEDVLLSVSEAFQRETSWHEHRPPSFEI